MLLTKGFWLCSLLLFSLHYSYAGDHQGRLTVRVTKTIGYYGDGNNGSPEYKHRFGFNNPSPDLGIDGGAEDTWYSTNLILSNGYYNNAPEDFSIFYRAYEYDGGGGSDNDDAKIGPLEFKFSPMELPAGYPNKRYILMYMYACSPKKETFSTSAAYQSRVNQLLSEPSCGIIYNWIYGAEITIEYTAPTPILKPIQLPAQKCFNDTLTLDVTGPDAFTKTDSYTYQYHLEGEMDYYQECYPNPDYCGPCSGGSPLSVDNPFGIEQLVEPPGGGGTDPCCDEPAQICETKSKPKWRTLPTSAYTIAEHNTTTERILLEIGDIPYISSHITSDDNFKIQFKVRANADYSNSEFSGPKHADVSAAAPTFTVAYTTESCQTDPGTGTIRITNVDGVGVYRYYLQTSRCSDPESDECVSFGTAKGNFTGSSVTIPNVAPGTYYVYVGNGGDTYGNCASYRVKTVDAIPLPVIDEATPSDASCPEGVDGSVDITISGGKDGNFIYELSPVVGTFNAGATDREGSFTGLSAGEYTLTVKDGCSIDTTKNFIIKQPPKITATTDPTTPRCYNEPDGKISIDASYDDSFSEYVKDGSGRFDYRVYNSSGQLVGEELNTTSTSHLFSGLPGDTYTIQVTDAAQPGCAAFETTQEVDAMTPLSLSLSDQKNITCFGAADGQITVSGSGGFNKYVYILTHTGSGEEITNTTGDFPGLKPGTYEVALKNDVSTCSDQYQLPETVTLTQPDEMTIALTPEKITCFESDNGALTVSAEGLLSEYTFQWEWNGASYKNGDQSESLDLFGLFPGTYKLTITNSNGCVKSSQSYTMVEPEILTIDAVDVERPECFGEVDGTIIPHISGGWGDYTWYYSDDNQATWTQYNETRQFGPATYHIKVIDIEGCETVYPDAIEFLAPDEPLDMELSITSRNGYGVSCFGGTDGEVNLTGSGGIAFNSDSPYLYSVNNEAFATAPVITGLAAGDHTFFIKDANGCVVEKTLNLPEPEALELSMSEKTDVKCFGDNSGSIRMVANGGVAGYEYNIDGNDYVNSPAFASLTSGTYTLGVRDLNGCETFTEVTIIELNNPMELGATVVNSSCYTYDDGHIETTMQGGVEPYSYSWSHGAATKDVGSLAPGTYTLTVTDAEGCITQGEYEITEPDNIIIEPEATLCQGQTYTIDATYEAEGAQYFWSSPNGFTSSDARITIEQAGIYTAEVSLPNGCVMSEQFELNRSDVLFNVNFLTATELEAGDTVIVVDVTDPRPDSVKWHFGGDITVIDGSEGHPQILYTQAGEYEVSFTAYFGGCVDHQAKTIKVYNKDEQPDNGRIYFGELGIKTATAFPNPNRGKFEVAIELHQRADLSLEIYDMYGLRVTEKQFSGRNFYTTSFDLSDNQSGVYLLRAVTGDEETVIKVLVNK